MRKRIAFAGFGLGCLCVSHLGAVMPKDAVVIEAETLAPENKAWEVKAHWDNWYSGHPSNNQFLSGDNNTQGGAHTAFDVPAAGTYYVWVRYLDLMNRQGEAGAFTVTVSQNGKTLGEGTLNRETLRGTEEGRKKWGGGWGQLVWQRVAFTAEQGKATLALGKPGTAGGGGGRLVDLFIITADEQYEGDVRDAHPLFVKVNILPEQEKPCVIDIGGRRSGQDHNLYIYLLGLGLHRGGMIGDYKVYGAEIEKLNPGESTPWVPFYKWLTFHRRDMVTFSAMAGRNDYLTNAAFEVVVSTTPDDSGIVLRETRRGSGSGMVVNFNLTTGEVLTERQGSEQSLAWAKATKPVEGAHPTLFPLYAQMSLPPETSQGEHIKNELDALHLIGINGMARNTIVHPDFPYLIDARFIWHLAKDWCQNNPRHDAIDNEMKRYAEEFHAKKPCNLLDLMDEPYFEVSHILPCDVCAEAFRKYVAQNGVTLDGRPSFSPDTDDPVRYYWSKRFQCRSMADYFRVGTTALHKYAPSIASSSLFSTELVFDGNLTLRGTDWFEILRSGGLTHGQTEDWNNYCATYQVLGIQGDTLRSACRTRGYPHGVFNIIDGRSAWDITAKSFAHIGHGSKFIFFYNYGPYYAPTCDTASHRQEIYQAIKDVAYPTGAVEKHLTDPAAKVAKGDAAMLLSVTSDFWGESEKVKSAYGRERAYLHLLLTHCGYRLDILNEDDLSTEIRNYKVLFVTDSHLRAACLKPLADWVRGGGTLYLGAGALTSDEYNRPLGADKLLGITREPMNLVQKGGCAEIDLCHRKPVKETDGVPFYVGYQEPFNKAFTCGRGKVLFSGFFPGLSHIASSKKADPSIRPTAAEAAPDTNIMAAGEKCYSARTFEPTYRDYIKGLNLPVQPRLCASDPLIEANLIESPRADVIALSNWTGAPQTVTVTLNAAPQYDDRNIALIGATKLDLKRERGNALTVKLTLNAGGYILLPKWGR